MASFASRVPFINSSNANGTPKRSSWGDSRDPRDPPIHANDRAFPHIKDLITQAQPIFDPSTPVTEYLRQAENSLKTSQTSLSFGKVDIAFREYLRASEILLNIIPRHKDFGFFNYNNPKWSQSNKNARNVVASMSAQMEGVRKIIEDNNNRVLTKPVLFKDMQNVIEIMLSERNKA